MSLSDYEEFLGKFTRIVNDGLIKIRDSNVIYRIWNYDYTVWAEKPNEVGNRLGWLNSPDGMFEALARINGFRDEIINQNFDNIVLLGMGGSSLAPEFFSKAFESKDEYPKLTVVDTTDPDAIYEVRSKLNIPKTLILVSTKSGTTVETISLMKYFYHEFKKVLGFVEAGMHFVAITDPGSDLEDLAKKLEFRNVFLSDPNIGGRFSALSFFGLVPASLIGVDLNALLSRSVEMAEISKNEGIMDNNPARLGVTIGELANLGLNKLTIITSSEIAHFKEWLEQLIAESTGKNGFGILPVLEDQFESEFSNRRDRVFVFICLSDDEEINDQVELVVKSECPVLVIKLDDIYDVGKEFFRWEFAVSVAGKVIGVNPFDQPDVEATKKLTRDFLDSYKTTGSLYLMKPNFDYSGIEFFTNNDFEEVEDFKKWLLNSTASDENSYIGLQAFLNPYSEVERLIKELRDKLRKNFDVPVTYGFGPRFLHSTGQLHKGDSGKGVFIQFTSDYMRDVSIPDDPVEDRSTLTFGVLNSAQALGDYKALLDKSRKVIRIHLGKDLNTNLHKIIDLF